MDAISTMTPLSEIESFLAQFRYLCSAGFKSSLSFNSDENGHARVTLEVNLGFIQPPFTVPPPATTSPKKLRRSPSYYRRLQRRKEFRQQLSSNNESKYDVTEEVSIEVTSNEDVSNEVIQEHSSTFNACDIGAINVAEEESHLEKVDDCDASEEVDVNSFAVDEDPTKLQENEDSVQEVNEPRMNTIDKESTRHMSLAKEAVDNEANNVAKFDQNLSAIDNLRNLTASLDLIHRNRSYNYTYH